MLIAGMLVTDEKYICLIKDVDEFPERFVEKWDKRSYRSGEKNIKLQGVYILMSGHVECNINGANLV